MIKLDVFLSISAFLGEDKFICVRCFEIIGEYSAAACTRLYSLGSLFSAGYHHSYICLYYVYLWGAKKLFIFLTNNTVSDLKYI